MSSSAKGNSISTGIMPRVVALSKDSLTSVTMWMNTVESNTPPPKHNTIPVKRENQKTVIKSKLVL